VLGYALFQAPEAGWLTVSARASPGYCDGLVGGITALVAMVPAGIPGVLAVLMAARFFSV